MTWSVAGEDIRPWMSMNLTYTQDSPSAPAMVHGISSVYAKRVFLEKSR